MGITHLEVRRHPTWQTESKLLNAVPSPLSHGGRVPLLVATVLVILVITAAALR